MDKRTFIKPPQQGKGNLEQVGMSQRILKAMVQGIPVKIDMPQRQKKKGSEGRALIEKAAGQTNTSVSQFGEPNPSNRVDFVCQACLIPLFI